MELTISEIIKYAKDVGVVGLLSIILFGGFKGWWIWGRWHKEITDDLRAQLARMERERDEWKDYAMNATHVTEKAVDLAERRRRTSIHSGEQV